MTKALASVIAAAVLASCAGSSSNGDAAAAILTGGERFGWDQSAADAAELATFSYALYVDGTRSQATDVSCGTAPTSSRFACTCRLPQLTPGTHSLQIAAFVNDAGTVRESDRSPSVLVIAR